MIQWIEVFLHDFHIFKLYFSIERVRNYKEFKEEEGRKASTLKHLRLGMTLNWTPGKVKCGGKNRGISRMWCSRDGGWRSSGSRANRFAGGLLTSLSGFILIGEELRMDVLPDDVISCKKFERALTRWNFLWENVLKTSCYRRRYCNIITGNSISHAGRFEILRKKCDIFCCFHDE